MTRLLSLAVGVVAFAGLLVAFLFGLERLFIAEADEAKADAARQARVLETYAESSLKQLLRERMLRAEGEIERALKDPFLDDADYRLLVAREVQLPRVDLGQVPGPGPLTARDWVQRLKAGDLSPPEDEADPDSPWVKRLGLLGRVLAATRPCSPKALNPSVEAFLDSFELWRLPLRFDGPVLWVAIDALSGCDAINPELLQRLMRGGLGGARVLAGLQQMVLLRREALSADDFKFLCDVTLELGARLRVDDTGFRARCASRPAGPPWAREFEDGEWLEPGREGWFYKTTSGLTRGVRVDADALLDSIEGDMRSRGLLSEGDRLAPPGAAPAGVALDLVRVSLVSPSLRDDRIRAARRHGVKTYLLLAFAAVTLALVAVSLVAQRRKHRYLELKSDFVAAVSHELRTPLASLRVMAETLEHRLAGDDKAKDYPRRIVAEADALSGLVENILSFNRLDKDRWVAHRAPVPLTAFVAALEDEARAYGAAKVELTFEGFEGTRVNADGELLKLLFSNLLRNACRYNTQDPVVVRFAAVKDGRWLCVRAVDNGVGVPQESQQAVFEEFKRLKGQGGRGGPGSGLGLSLCRRIMELHRGTIDLEASSPAGSTFLMRFPTA